MRKTARLEAGDSVREARLEDTRGRPEDTPTGGGGEGVGAALWGGGSTRLDGSWCSGGYAPSTGAGELELSASASEAATEESMGSGDGLRRYRLPLSNERAPNRGELVFDGGGLICSGAPFTPITVGKKGTGAERRPPAGLEAAELLKLLLFAFRRMFAGDGGASRPTPSSSPDRLLTRAL